MRTFFLQKVAHNSAYLTFCGLLIIMSTSCKESGSSEELSTSQSKTQSQTLIGTWQDQDQLMLLDKFNGEPIDVVVGFNLDVKSAIATAEKKHNKKIVDWMLLETKRTFFLNKHQIDSTCSTLSGQTMKLSVSAPIQLNEAAKKYTLPEEERSQVAALGVFECTASIAGKVSRSYNLSPDGQSLMIILGNEPEDKIILRR